MQHVIFALNKKDVNTDLAFMQAHKIDVNGIEILEGVYQGEKETSYKLATDKIGNYELFVKLLKDTDQDCILLVAGDLAYIGEQSSDYKANCEALGKYKTLTAQQAAKEQFSSYNKMTGQYFIYA